MSPRLLLPCLLAPLALAQTTPAAPRPNLLFIEVDDLTAKYLNAFGGQGIPTPAIDRLAARGMVFENGVAPAAMCAPSRNALITGRHPHHLGLYANTEIAALPRDIWSFPAALRRAGYATAWVGKCHILANTDGLRGTPSARRDEAMRTRMGFDTVWQSAGRHVAYKKAEAAAGKSKGWKAGIDAYADHLHDRGLLDRFLADGTAPTTLPEDDYLDGLIGKRAAEQTAALGKAGQPFFLWVNFSAPHGPYNCPERFLKAAQDIALPAPIVEPDAAAVPACLRPHAWTRHAGKTRQLRADYAGMITYVDTQVDRILRALDESGAAENTLVVFFSDHGIMNADHGLDHKETLYKEVLNPSLIIAGPGVKRGAREARPVEVLDLVPTVLEYAGAAEADRRQPVGHSLTPLLAGRDGYARRFAIAEIAEATAMVTPEFKYIACADGAKVLFDVRNDRDEVRNLAAKRPEVVAAMERELADWRARTGPFIKPTKSVGGDLDND